MIEILQQHIGSETSRESKINKLREMLQILCLKILQDKGCFSNISFVGGTALRILYNLKRFSEDLDFSVIERKEYDFLAIISILKHNFNLFGLDMEADYSKEIKTVQSSMLKFPGLLKTLGMSELKDRKLSIKIEIDSNPPAGWKIENTVVNNIYILNITHFDIPSLYATKIYACFFRKYVKGRDFYDLLWYLGKKVKPNYVLLNNAIEQTQGKSPALNDENIKGFLLNKIKNIEFKAIRKDVERFIEDKNELKLLDASIISKGIVDAFGI